MSESSKEAWAFVMAAVCWCGIALVIAGIIIALGHAPLSAKVLIGVGIVVAAAGWFLSLSIQSETRNNVSRETFRRGK